MLNQAPSSSWIKPTNNNNSSSNDHTHRPRTQGSSSFRIKTATTSGRGMTAKEKERGEFLVALIQNRGLGREVGVVGIDKETGDCVVSQFPDTQTYVKTIHHLTVHPPSAILMVSRRSLHHSTSAAHPETDANSILAKCLEEVFEVPITMLERRYWNHEEGARYLDKLLTRTAVMVSVSTKYYALSACCALFKYLEERTQRFFIPRSLRIRFVVPDGTVMIDTETARQLELVVSLDQSKTKLCLFGLLNHCVTPMAQRILRMNILQPLTDLNTIESRLDAVEECIQSEERFFAIKESLKPLGSGGISGRIDLDKLIHLLISTENKLPDPKRTEGKIGQVLSLRTLIRSIAPVKDALEGTQSGLIAAIREFLRVPQLEEMDRAISETINEDVITAKGGIYSRNTRAYAVKADRSPLLDVARETYKENTSDIIELCNQLSGNVYLSLSYAFEVKACDINVDALPRIFTNVVKVKNGRAFSMMTLDLKKLNRRMQDSLNEVYLMSDLIIDELRCEILKHVASLYKVSEALALLDMIVSFSHLSTACRYVRPEITGALAVKNGRHPILDRMKDVQVVPNDVYAADGANFYLITGPNMSGKSVFIRQVALLNIMAMIGCFVPAEYASFPIPDSILARLSNDDDITQNLSTFAKEMRCAAYILSMATCKSLVLLDELARGTSPEEGFVIAHAISEELIERRCLVIFATHMKELTESLKFYPSVTFQHFKVDIGDEKQDFNMRFFHRLVEGQCEESHYGLELAKMVGLPLDLIQEAMTISEELAKRKLKDKQELEKDNVYRRRKICFRVVAQVKQALRHSNLPEEELREYLLKLQEGFVDELSQTFPELVKEGVNQAGDEQGTAAF
ncbi:hypothetical protein IE53DRAFT_327721 [Violaceomyces palustris]|uniref:Uncharacterized protein n=1 Tax=Violaceomyces palustris TaxID=1673888 RepID=A0ACD0P1G9_9BASI|nr:hypothetical protein IE53DRAFT_327721 [Violaceomyces palustris]